MGKTKIDFLKNKSSKDNFLAFSSKKLFSWKRVLLYFLIILLVGGLSFSYKVILSSENILKDINSPNLLEQIKHLVTNPDKKIAGEEEDRINILLLGMGGAGHQGVYLTDTIIIASIKPSTEEIALLSIPRDLFVPIPGFGWRKINNANAFGEMSNYPGSNYPGGGANLTAKVISEITSLPIQYYVRVDFEGFRRIIDNVGGINVYVERSFTDYQFPTYDFGYQTVSFQEGWQHMDGETALQYSRSRHGNNNEGSDFARSQRQQKVLLAVKDKLFSFSTLINPKTILEVLESLGDHTQTNLELWEMIKIAKLAKNLDFNNIINKVIDNRNGGPLHAETTIDGAYILRPNAGPDDFSEIQTIALNIFSWSYIAKEDAQIEIQNGTTIPGLADSTAKELEALDYNIIKVGNAKKTDYEKTVIYDLSAGQNPHTLKSLREKLDANVSTFIPPFLDPNYTEITFSDLNYSLNSDFQNLNHSSEEADLIVVLGQKSQYRIQQASNYLPQS